MMQAGTASEEIALIKRKCANVIFEFDEAFQKMKELYDEFGLYYPKECNTNYRDAWFHYRKLYTRKDRISVLNEKYGLEEHLLRAVKDAQIYLLQQLGEWLEIWRNYNTYLVCDHFRDKEYIELLRSIPPDERNWVLCIWKKSRGDRVLFSNTCLYQFEKKVNLDRLQKNFYELLCGIKNLILDLRLGGVNIYRPSDNLHYLRKCINIYNGICDSLRESHMQYLISSTELIYDICRKRDDTVVSVQ